MLFRFESQDVELAKRLPKVRYNYNCSFKNHETLRIVFISMMEFHGK